MRVAIIQARLGSRRLPQKVLKPLQGRPILQHVIERVQRAKLIDDVMVATCYPGAGPIGVLCDKLNVDYYAHDNEKDVLGRFVAAAEIAQASWVVRVCGDSPMIHPGCIDALVKLAERQKKRPHYVTYATKQGRPIVEEPTGYFAEVVWRGALAELNHVLAPKHPWREHVTMGLYHQPARYRCHLAPLPKWYRENRSPKHTAIDTQEDFDRVEAFLGQCQSKP